MRKFLLILAAFLVSSISFVAFGNVPELSVSMKPDSILIGDRVELDVTVRKDVMQVIDFPVFKDGKMSPYVEIVRELPPDTLNREGRSVTVRKRYIITSFDAGTFSFDKFPVLYLDKNTVDTLYAPEQLTLKVTAPPVDTLKTTIYDIKRPEETPVLVSEYRGYVVWTIVILCTLAALAYRVMRYIKHRNAVMRGLPPDERSIFELPHIRAIRELEELHSQKLWQGNKHKQYYTRLTDIVRTYLDGRYGIGAMEMTSDEILTAVKEYSLPDKNSKELKAILYTADLVKFAKYIPDGDENEKMYYDAYYFVEETKETAGEDNADWQDILKTE